MAHEPTARNAWAPELFYDEAKKQWLIFWATTIPGKFPETDSTGNNGLNHRIYYVTTKDFQTFSATKLPWRFVTVWSWTAALNAGLRPSPRRR